MKKNQTFIKKLFTKKKEITTKLGEKITIRSVKDYDVYKNKKYDLKKSQIKLYIRRIIATGLAVFLIPIPYIFQNQKNQMYEEVLKQNYEIACDYNEYIKYYSDYFNKLGIDNTLEMIMKVMYDMRDEIYSYNLNASGNFNKAYRLAFTYQDGEGVCKNLADDLTARLNAINPNLNARNLVVYDNSNKDVSLLYKLVGNHMVTIINPNDEDYTIVIDPTNVAIGIITNGKIKVCYKDNIIEYEYSPIGQIFTAYDSTTNEINYEFLKSIIYHKNNNEINEIFKKYGLDAQMEAFNEIIKYEEPKEKKLMK